MPTPFDDELKEFIDFEKHDRARKAERDDELRRSVQRVADQQSLTAGNLALLAVEFREQMKGVHSRLTSLEEADESTGNHNLENYKEQLREARGDKAKLLGWVIAGIGSVSLLLLGGAGSVIWFLIVKGH